MNKKRKLNKNKKKGTDLRAVAGSRHEESNKTATNIGTAGTLKPKRGRLTKTASRRRRARKKAFMMALIVLLSITGAVATFVLVFRLETVTVEGQSIYGDNELIGLIPIVKDENIFMFSPTEVEEKILDEFVYIETVDVRRHLPATISIEVTPSIERYAIEIGGDRYIISSSLKTLRIAEEGDVFCGIVGLNPMLPEIGEPLESIDENKQNMLLLLLEELEKVQMLEKVVEINITDTLNMEFIYDGKITVLLGSDISMDYKMQMISKVLRESIQESEVGVIDASVPGKVVFKAA